MARFLIALWSASSLLVGAHTAHAQSRRWRVRSGEILSQIAREAGVSVRELRDWNALSSDRIVVGQELRLEPESSEATPREHAEASRREVPSTEDSATDEPVNAEVPNEARPVAEPFEGVRHRVRPGETMSAIAARHGVSLNDLRTLNPDVVPERLRAGTVLRIRREYGRRARYEVQRGDTLSAIGARFEVSPRDLQRWNPRLRRRGLRAGETLTLWTEVPESRSESVGAPNGGRLQHAVRLSPHRLYEIRDPARAFGTLETVRAITGAFDAVRTRHGAGRRVEVHDLSRRRGGHLHGHRSHQSGRDADIAYFRRRCDGACDFRPVRARNLDVERQWTLFHYWLANGLAEVIFIDFRLQEALYEEARRRGATRAQLSRWFQFPHGRGSRLGQIRHYPKHRDHIHVRFTCPETDGECRRTLPRRRTRGRRR